MLNFFPLGGILHAAWVWRNVPCWEVLWKTEHLAGEISYFSTGKPRKQPLATYEFFSVQIHGIYQGWREGSILWFCPRAKMLGVLSHVWVGILGTCVYCFVTLNLLHPAHWISEYTWVTSSTPLGVRPINSFWVFKWCSDSSGEVAQC